MSICPEPEEHDRDTSYYLTLDNIYKYASDDELRAIVSSIHLRLGFYYKQIMDKYSIEGYELTDKEINKVAKGLRKPQ